MYEKKIVTESGKLLGSIRKILDYSECEYIYSIELSLLGKIKRVDFIGDSSAEKKCDVVYSALENYISDTISAEYLSELEMINKVESRFDSIKSTVEGVYELKKFVVENAKREDVELVSEISIQIPFHDYVSFIRPQEAIEYIEAMYKKYEVDMMDSFLSKININGDFKEITEIWGYLLAKYHGDIITQALGGEYNDGTYEDDVHRVGETHLKMMFIE